MHVTKMMSAVSCSTHSSGKATLYCHSCQQTVCERCLNDGSHAYHQIISLELGYQSGVRDLREKIQLVEQMRARTIGNIQLLDRTKSKKDTLASIITASQTLQRQVQKMVRQLLQTQTSLQTLIEKAAQKVHRETIAKEANRKMRAVREAARWTKDMKRVLNTNSLLCLLQQKTTMMRRLASLEKALDMDEHKQSNADSTSNSNSNSDSDSDSSCVVKTKLETELRTIGKQTSALNQTATRLLKEASEAKRLLICAGGNKSCLVARSASREVFFKSTVAYEPDSDKWFNLAPMAVERHHAAAALWKGTMVVAGGRSYNSAALKSAEQYNPRTNTWTSFSSLRDGRRGLAMVTANDAIFAIGGWNGKTHFQSVECYKESNWQYTKPLHIARRGSAAAKFKNGILVVGGFGGKFEASCEYYNLALDTWKQLAPLRTARWYASVASHADRFYVVGGRDARKALDCIELYDAAGNKWTQLAVRLSMCRSESVAATLNGRIYVAGGWPNYDVVDCVDTLELSCTQVSPLPQERGGAAAVTLLVSNSNFHRLSSRATLQANAADEAKVEIENMQIIYKIKHATTTK